MLSKSSRSMAHPVSELGVTNRIREPRGEMLRRSSARRMRNAFALCGLLLILFSGAAQAGNGVATARLDLNRATAEQLEALPGIGEVKAAAILAVRDANGGFHSIGELEAVRGIGPVLAAKLEPLLKIESRARKSAQPKK